MEVLVSMVGEDKSITILAILAIVLAVIAITSVFYSGVIYVSLIGNVVGEANLTIASEVNINTTRDLDWGEGRVDVDQSSAQLNTSQGTVSNGNWTAVTTGLLIQNNGNVNVSLALKSSVNDSELMGGTGYLFEWNISNFEANSCGDRGNFDEFDNFSTVNTSSGLAGDGTIVCIKFDYISTADVLELDFSIVVPEDVAAGQKSSLITMVATAV